MEVKSTEWRPGPTVCRCCLSEGCYKDISTEYFWMGKREVYAEMLSETFDVTIGFSKSGGPNSNSRLICEPCISRLRDASEFKRQVLECEKTFMQHLDPGTSTSADLDITVDTDKEVKLERVKTEKRLSDDDFDDRVGFDDDDDDDDLDDEPLTKLASKVPKKESVDLLDLLDNAKVAEKRKSTAKTKSTPAKKSKKETIQPTPSKSVKIEKKKKDDEQIIARRNAEIVVKYTTAYPFRVPENSMLCVYCCETIEDPSLYRKHMEEVHKSFEIKMAFYHCNEGCIKVDCTDLRCRVCSQPYGNLDAICKHLYNDHGFKVNLKIPPALQPFKLEKDKMLCGICNVQGHSLRQLGRHMASHFLKFMCEECGKSYSTVTTLKQHVTFRHIKDERICRKCKKTFSSMEAKRKHLDETQRCRQYVCGECGDRFITDVAKQHHRKEVHGMIKTYSCRICKENFDDNRKCYRHYMMLHSEDKYICSTCAKTFKYKNDLERHMNIHTKDRAFACTICSKAFSRKTVLDQHMWIHSEQKRFQCALCKKQFNQKVSLKTHMKSHHPEMVDCV